ALAFVRGELIGLFGLPVALLEAAALAGVAVWAVRTSRFSGPRLGAAFAAAVAAIHVAASLLRPSLPVLDTDIELLLGVAALVLAVLVARGTSVRRVVAVGTGGAIVVGGLGVLAVLDGGGTSPAVTPVHVQGDLLAGALTSADLDTTPPAFGPDEFAAVVAASEGRPIVVNFWASWCPPCRAEAPALARSARALGDRVVFLGVNVNDDPRGAAGFVERYDLPFPSVRDAGLSAHLGMRGLPTTVVLRSDGTVAAHMVGGVDPGSLAAAVTRAGG
ncbi:MAG: TlpA family protein disulfide reductase, partial [Nitriliruptorales bacterium]